MPKLDYRYRLAMVETQEIEAMLNEIKPKDALHYAMIEYINFKIQEAFDAGLKEGHRGGATNELFT